MNTNILSLLIPFLAGFSTLLGYFPTYIPIQYHNQVIGVSLAFSAGIMISISFLSLIPEAFSYLEFLSLFPKIIIFSIFFLLGILFSSSLDEYLSKRILNTKLYQLGIISMITLMIHNIPEGIMTCLTTSNDLKLGFFLSLAIAFHNIPEGIAIAIPIYYASKNRFKAITYTAISGFSEFLGAIFAYFFLKQYISSFLLMTILDMTAGIMIHISLTELIPTSLDYIKVKEMIVILLLGILSMFLCISFFQL